jgi:hypothetical protein
LKILPIHVAMGVIVVPIEYVGGLRQLEVVPVVT